MGFSRQEYWSGLPLPSPGDLPDLGIEPRSSTMEADALTSEPPGNPGERITAGVREQARLGWLKIILGRVCRIFLPRLLGKKKQAGSLAKTEGAETLSSA